jgi:dipeptidyl aminopeptidase/acylaminoacyl peptidase
MSQRTLPCQQVIIRTVKRIILIGLLLAVLLVGVGVLVVLTLSPRVTAFVPAPDSHSVPAGSSFEIYFNRSMRAETVLERLGIDPHQEGEFTWQGQTLVFTPRPAWPSETTVTVTLAPGAAAADGLRLSMLNGAEWQFQISQPQIVYLFPADAPADLYLLDPESGEIQRLTTIAGGILDFSVSPDGRSIFYSTRAGNLGHYDRLSGRATAFLTCTGATCNKVQVSPDGHYLAYERIAASERGQRAYPQVWVMHLEGGEPFIVDQAAVMTETPQWSLDGWLAYYVAVSQEFHFWHPEHGLAGPFPNQTGEPGAWLTPALYLAPEIRFIPHGFIDESGELLPIPTSHLIGFDLNTQTTIDLSGDDTLEDISPAFSHQSRRLVFSRKFLDPGRWTPGRQLWVGDFNPDARQLENLRQVTDSPHHNHSAFNWRQDGTALLFLRSNQSVLTEPAEIWMVEFPSGIPVQVVIGGYSPQWIP